MNTARVKIKPADTMGHVPNKPKTPIRGVRVPDELWEDAQAIAKALGETVSDEVRRGLESYVERNRAILNEAGK